MKNHNMFNSGIADVWYSSNNDYWVEYKFISIPVRPNTMISLTEGAKPELTVLQQQWLSNRHAEGRNVGVVVGCKEGGVWYPGLSWKEAVTAAEFRDRLRSRKDVASLIKQLVDYR